MNEINGDKPLSFFGKLQYLTYNFLRGIWGYTTYQSMQFWSFVEYKESADSPGRRYLDYFIVKEIPRIVPQKELRVLDVGCGSGYLKKMLKEVGYSGLYTGIDVKRHPQYKDGNNAFKDTFIETKIEDYHPSEKFDLVISNTSFEHIEDDVTAATRCAELTNKAGTQVHIVPSFWALFAYLWHGYRQYTPRRIKKVFYGQHYKVYRLGGLASLLLHVFSTTLIERIIGLATKRNSSWYPKAVYRAQQLDKFLPFCSLMYVIVVYNND